MLAAGCAETGWTHNLTLALAINGRPPRRLQPRAAPDGEWRVHNFDPFKTPALRERCPRSHSGIADNVQAHAAQRTARHSKLPGASRVPPAFSTMARRSVAGSAGW